MKLAIYLLIILFNPTMLNAQDQIRYYLEIDVNKKGQLIGKKRIQDHLGNYLYQIQNEKVIQAKIRNGQIIEFNSKFKIVYAVYQKNRIKEIGEKTINKNEHSTEQKAELSHLHRYNKQDLLKRIDHYKVSEDQITFRYYQTGSTYFIYNKNKNLIQEIRKSSKGKITQSINYHYNSQNQQIKKTIQNHQNNNTSTYEYFYNPKKQIIKENISKNNKNIKSINYHYNSQNTLLQIKTIATSLPHYQNIKKEKIKQKNLSKNIETSSLLFNSKNSKQQRIIGFTGLLPNVKSYIRYYFTKKPYQYQAINKEGQTITKTDPNAIYSKFNNYSLPNHQLLNRVEIISDYLGKEFEIQWYNKYEQELFSKIPNEIRLMRAFNLNNLLNIQHVIFGKVLTPNQKPIKNEIIVEIYSKKTIKLNWCYFGNSYYYYIVRFSDKEKIFNKINILKAGFQYKSVQFNMKQNKTLIQIPTTHLKNIN